MAVCSLLTSTETIYIIELIRASLEQRKAEEKPENILWEKLYELVGVHMVSSITFYQIDKLEKKPPQQIYRLWKEKAEKALVKEISFDAERRIILEKFEQAGIKYIPLKVLKKLLLLSNRNIPIRMKILH